MKGRCSKKKEKFRKIERERLENLKTFRLYWRMGDKRERENKN